MTVLQFPLERRYVEGDRVAFETEQGARVTGTVMEPRADRPGEVRVWSDKGGTWRVPPEALERLDLDGVVIVEPPASPMRLQMLRRVASLYRALDAERLNADVKAGVEAGRYANPIDGMKRRRQSIREKLSYYFTALGRPISREEALARGR